MKITCTENTKDNTQKNSIEFYAYYEGSKIVSLLMRNTRSRKEERDTILFHSMPNSYPTGYIGDWGDNITAHRWRKLELSQ